MNSRLLTLASAVVLSLFSGVALASGHVDAAHARVIVVRGSADHMEQVLHRAKVEFALIDPGQLAAVPLNARQVVMVNCLGDLPPAAQERVRKFVTAGGFLYTTDHAVDHLIEPVFPNTIAWTRQTTNQEIVPVRLHGKYEDRGLLAHLGGNAAERWQLASGGHAFKVLDPQKVEILMESPEMAKRYGSGAIAARIRWGDGIIIHVSGHFDGQGGDAQSIAAAGKTFDQFSANIVAAKEADAPRLDKLYGGEAKREVTLSASPSAPAAANAPALTSGTRLNVLERKGDKAKVRDMQGNEGWVDSDAL